MNKKYIQHLRRTINHSKLGQMSKQIFIQFKRFGAFMWGVGGSLSRMLLCACSGGGGRGGGARAPLSRMLLPAEQSLVRCTIGLLERSLKAA
jgi:hypothetical protein